MAKAQGQVTLRGRFPVGEVVALVEVAGPHVLRAAGGKTIARQKVREVGGVPTVVFDSDVAVDGRYFIVGQVNGQHLEVRVRGTDRSEESTQTTQLPNQYEPRKFADGTLVDEPVERAEDDNALEGAPHLAMRQVPEGTVLRSDTPHGVAHPVDLPEEAPYGSQADTDDLLQMSDTEAGQRVPIDVHVAVSQAQIPDGTIQRSDTPVGVATPIHTGGPVAAQRDKESVDAKEKRGEPGKAAALPLTGEAEGVADVALKDTDKDSDAGTTAREALEHQEAEADRGASVLDTQGEGQPSGSADELTGDELNERAAKLNIKGRSGMTADEKRAAIADAERKV